MRRALLLLPIVAAACLGSGSDPTPAPGAPGVHAIFSVPTDGTRVIRQATVDASRMLVLVQSSSTGPSSAHRGTIESVPFDGSPETKAFDVDDSEGMFVSSGAAIFYAASNTIANASVDVFALGADGGAPAKLGSSTTTGSSVGGIVADANAIFFATTIPGPVLLEPPNGSTNPGGNPNGALYRIDRTTHAVTQLFPPSAMGPGPIGGVACGWLKTCLWYDSGALYFLQGIDKGGAALARISPATSAVTQIATFDSRISVTGVAFDATSIYWSQYDPTLLCSVMRVAKSGGAPITVASTNDTECRDLVIDRSYAYVATVGPLYLNDPGGPLRGTGIARAPLAGGSFAIAPMQRDDWYGAMRLEVDDQSVYAVSPNVILQVPKSAL